MHAWAVALCAAGMALGVRSIEAQSAPAPMRLVDTRGPRFVSEGEAASADVRSAAVFARMVALDLHGVTAAVAVDSIARAAHLVITYGPASLAHTAPISLSSSGITVGAALTAVLFDAGVDVELARDGAHLTLVPRGVGTAAVVAKARASDSAGVVVGIITDEKTGSRLAGVVVHVEGTGHGATTGFDGTYAVRRVPVGTRVLTFRRLGYAVVRRSVEVAVDSSAHVNVALTPSPLILDQVVTTVTGDQALRSMGNTIGTINADSLVPTTPVANFGDLLNARVAGVQVLAPGGLTGASPEISIRGIGGLLTSTQPILYVDGVRVSNSFVTQYPGGSNAEIGGRLNDIVPGDIESIEVVKGPSASTLYGTDAANGVILVTTKRGTAGKVQWNGYAEGAALTINPDEFTKSYAGWGHSPSGQATNACTLQAVGAGQCVQDSITTFSPIRVPSLTPLGTGNHEEVGLQVSGGSSSARYFASGGYVSEVGYLKMPVADRALLDSAQGTGALSGEALHPNAVTKYNGRLNATFPLGGAGDVSLSTGLMSNDSRVPNADVLGPGLDGPGYRDANDGWLFGSRPYQSFAVRNDESTTHFTTSGSARWTPLRWLSGHATAGLDYSNEFFDQLTPAGLIPGNQGERFNERENLVQYSVDLGASASVPLVSWLRSVTSVGAQYNRSSIDGTIATAGNLMPGSTTVAGGVANGAELNNESIVAGVYAEERLGLNDRLFVTGAVRVDGANDFGANYQSAAYPKVSISWLLSEEPFFPHIPGLNALRLRAAYGESGTQPGLSLTTLHSFNAYSDGNVVLGDGLSTIANPNLQPERQKETEGGIDADFLKRRIHAEFTYYTKRNTNALYSVPLGASVGGGSETENIGEVWNWGYEASLMITAISSRALNWTINANAAFNHNQIITLGPYFQPVYGLYGAQSFVAGYPAYSYFDLPITGYTHPANGILQPADVTVGTTPKFISPSYPPTQLTLATHLGVLNGRFAIGAQFDYRGGFRLPNSPLANQCFFNACAAALEPHTSLAQQAAVIADQQGVGTFWGYYSDAEFVRFRELSLTYNVDPQCIGRIGARSLSVTLAARNLALWTHYTGADPETNSLAGQSIANGVPQYGPYNSGGLPPAQYWLLRVNVGY